MGQFDDDMFGQFTVEKVPVAADMTTACEMRAKIDVSPGFYKDQLRYHLRSYVHALGKETVSVHETWPATWWDHFKERWFPKWAINRWPIQYRSIDIDRPVFAAVCPHLQIESQDKHITFLTKHDRSELCRLK